jgi:hypothetical protein
MIWSAVGYAGMFIYFATFASTKSDFEPEQEVPGIQNDWNYHMAFYLLLFMVLCCLPSIGLAAKGWLELKDAETEVAPFAAPPQVVGQAVQAFGQPIIVQGSAVKHEEVPEETNQTNATVVKA